MSHAWYYFLNQFKSVVSVLGRLALQISPKQRKLDVEKQSGKKKKKTLKLISDGDGDGDYSDDDVLNSASQILDEVPCLMSHKT